MPWSLVAVPYSKWLLGKPSLLFWDQALSHLEWFFSPSFWWLKSFLCAKYRIFSVFVLSIWFTLLFFSLWRIKNVLLHAKLNSLASQLPCLFWLLVCNTLAWPSKRLEFWGFFFLACSALLCFGASHCGVSRIPVKLKAVLCKGACSDFLLCSTFRKQCCMPMCQATCLKTWPCSLPSKGT